jgi:nitroimidazol reductase NimA-like FMN-containing flavoprotein (pyridoxamine 5'-phosphate oxidase superfamily)
MSEPVPVPQFRALSREACEAVLARNFAGRIAYVRANRVEIIPIHYVFAAGAVLGRTAPGTSMEEASHNFYGSWPAAFEVDEIEGLFQWRSVVVHGSFRAALPGSAEWKRNPHDWEDASRAFQTLIPDAFTERDPTGFRSVVIRIEAAEISGREALPGSGGPPAG